jgi:hypothetical protein
MTAGRQSQPLTVSSPRSTVSINRVYGTRSSPAIFPWASAVRFAIALATITIILSFKIAGDASRLGQAVAQRFLERGDSIPPDTSPITRDALEAWATNPDNAAAIRGYIYRILPWDVAFLVCLGCFLGLGSASLAPYANWPKWLSQSPAWCFWVIPCLYMLADLTEDATIARMLSSPSAIEQPSFDFMRLVTQLKKATAGISLGQLLLVFASGLHRNRSRSSFAKSVRRFHTS